MKLSRFLLASVTAIAIINTIACIPGETILNNPDKIFVKLDKYGNPLPIQTKTWNTNDATAAESKSDRWSCLLDETTGLIWELKTHDGGLRDYKHIFTWYDSNAATNGGEHGIGDLGAGASTGFETWRVGEFFGGSDDCNNKSRCDTEKYVEDVNTVGLCGANDWRMPTKDELKTLGYSKNTDGLPHIDLAYFTDSAYTYSGEYVHHSFWTSTTNNAYIFEAHDVPFSITETSTQAKYYGDHIRLVRTAP